MGGNLDTPERRRRRLILAAILTATAAVYLPFIGHAFQYDDWGKLVENPRIQDPGSYFAAFGKRGYSEDTTRLLPNLSYCADYILFRLSPSGWHLTNLLFHLVNVWLVSRLGRALLRRFGEPGDGVALLAAALFGLHPLNSEAVLYCNARPNVMAAGFMMATLLNFLRAVDAGSARRWGLCAATLVGGLLCKELAASVLILMPLVLYWQGGDLSRFRKPVAAMAAATILVGALSGALSGVSSTLAAGGERSGSWPADLGLTGLTQSAVFIHYMGLLFVPWPGFLTVFHPVLSLQERMPAGIPAWTVLSAVALAAALGLSFVLRRRFPVPTFAFLWFFVALSPTFLFPRGEAMVEYRTYAGMSGACIGLAWALRRSLPAGLVVAALLAAGTAWRATAWRTETSLWSDAVEKGPSVRGCTNLASGLRREGRLREAIVELRRAITLDPTKPIAATNLGLLLLQIGHTELAERLFGDVTKDFPGWARGWYGLGLAQAGMGRAEDAVVSFSRALDLAPGDGMAQARLAAALLGVGRTAEAEVLAAEALRRQPGVPLLNLTLGRAQQAQGRLDEAARAVLRALESAPTYTDARKTLGLLREAQGRPAEARAEYETGLKHDARSGDLHRQLGELLKRQGDEAGARIHLEEAAACDRDAEEKRRQQRALAPLQ